MKSYFEKLKDPRWQKKRLEAVRDFVADLKNRTDSPPVKSDL
jgi:hypothetical protein